MGSSEQGFNYLRWMFCFERIRVDCSIYLGRQQAQVAMTSDKVHRSYVIQSRHRDVKNRIANVAIS